MAQASAPGRLLVDALPPALVHCEAAAPQNVLMTVNGDADEKSFAAFTSDLRLLDGGWSLVSDISVEGRRTFVLRARANVTYDAVTDATENATARGWKVRVTFDSSNCMG